MYTTKILTHIIRLSDGHVMPDWIDVKVETGRTGDAGRMEADRIKKDVKAGLYDTDNYAVRMRRYPVSRHEIDVELWDEDRFIGSPRRMW